MSFSSRPPAARRTLWSALAGGALGLVLGWATAPRRGPDLRRRLAYQLTDLARRTGRLARRLAASGTDSEARRTRDALVADAEARANHIRDDIEALLDELRRHDPPPAADTHDAPADAPSADAPSADAPSADAR
jgi:gas vesicle protein